MTSGAGLNSRGPWEEVAGSRSPNPGPHRSHTVLLSNNAVLCFLAWVGYWGRGGGTTLEDSITRVLDLVFIPRGWIKMPLTPWGA